MAEPRDKSIIKFFSSRRRRSSTQRSEGIESPSFPPQARPQPVYTPQKKSHLRPSWSRASSHTGIFNSSSAPGLTGSPLAARRPQEQQSPLKLETPLPGNPALNRRVAPVLTVQESTPDHLEAPNAASIETSSTTKRRSLAPPTPDSGSASPLTGPSLHPGLRPKSITALSAVDTPPITRGDKASAQDYFGQAALAPHPVRKMVRRKIWIKRAGASPTLVTITDDDLVDDVRDMVLRKYANSLGRTWDAPDVTLRVIPRERSQHERCLGPDEPMCSLLDAYFPGGQTVEEALLVDVPRRHTPLPSPRPGHPHFHHEEGDRPLENGTDYFPPMALASPALSHTENRQSLPHPPHAISVIETGQLPNLPSPNLRERKLHSRPKAHRQHTSSPTILSAAVNNSASNAAQHHPRQQWSRMNSDQKHQSHRHSIPPAPPLPPTPPIMDNYGGLASLVTSPGALDSPRNPKSKKTRNKASVSVPGARLAEFEEHRAPVQSKTFSTIEATVPPINVLIVEDNPINLKLLEQFTRRLKVRWSSVMNGRDAVTKWRSGGFHLVLMDIQLPIMSGLEATKEIRRLERVNGIGVFARGDTEDTTMRRTGSAGEPDAVDEVDGVDKLSTDGLFKSPVIIVALTASSLQSDRHEALAAGCNDFLTKPVLFTWLERKVMEWGCMQALIDFDGWRKWKAMAAAAEAQQQKDEDLDPAAKAKREKRDAKRAAMLAKMGAQ